MMVVLFHLNANTHAYAVTRNAWVSVDFFFVLSGFVLMSGFGGKISDAPKLGRFALRRLARLYPLHLVTLLVLIALVGLAAWNGHKPMFADAHSLGGLLQCLALVQGFTTEALSWNFPSWSISIELWASLGFGLILWLAGTRTWIVFAVVAILLTATIVVCGEPDGPAATPTGAVLKAGHYILAFVAGALLFKLFARAAGRGWKPPAWIEWPALAVVAAIFMFADQLDAEWTIALFAAVIFIFAFEAGVVSAGLRASPFQAIGRWSYSIYLIHPFWTIWTVQLLAAAGHRMGRTAIVNDDSGELVVLGGPLVMDVVAITCLIAVVATAALTYRFIEKPGTRLAQAAP